MYTVFPFAVEIWRELLAAAPLVTVSWAPVSNSGAGIGDSSKPPAGQTVPIT